MSYITLENFYHLILVFRRILIEVFYEGNEIRVRGVGNFLVLDKFEDMVVALELLLSAID